MRSRIISVNMMTGKYVDMFHSHTIVTFEDNSETLRPNIVTNQYTVYQPGYFLKGPSDMLIVFEGDNVLAKWDKLLGTVNTNYIGPMGTYAYRALLSGFRVATIRIAPPEATYPNFYVAMDMKAELDSKTGEMKETTLYVEYDTVGDYYHMSLIKETLPNKDNVVAITFPKMHLQFAPFTIEDCRQTTDVDEFLGDTVYRLDVSSGTEITKEDIIHIPLFGMVYTGRGSYGNNFVANFTTNGTLVQDKYPYFNCQVVDTEMKSTDHEFNFTLFDVQNDLKRNQGFFDQATEECKVSFTATNEIPTMRPYQIDKGRANQTTKAVNAMMDKYSNMILAKIKREFPEFDELVSASDWYQIEDTVSIVKAAFEKGTSIQALTVETPFSYVNPFDNELDGSLENSVIGFTPCPRNIPFQGGVTGELEKILNEKGFSWDIKVPIPTDDIDVGTVEYIEAKPAAIGLGRDTTVKVQFSSKEQPMSQFFVDELAKCYTGEITNTIFDQAILPDSLIMGEDYPFKLQEVVADFVQYKYTIQNNDKTRPDCTYWRTPDKSIKTIDQVVEWARAFNRNENLRMVPMVGSWMFDDETTGGTNRFSATYEYFGEDSTLLNYLTSLTSDSFASGDYSVIYKGKPNTQMLVPQNKNEREELTLLDIMYFTVNPDRRFVLSYDTAWKPNKNSKLKYLGSSIQYGRIIRECTLVMRRHQIITISPEIFNDIKNELAKVSADPAQHFQNRVEYSVALSGHVNEAGQDIPLATVRVTGNDYANRNRILFTIENSANATA